MDSIIEINQDLLIPIREIAFNASRSSKPGGQNVNKVNSRVMLLFDVVNSSSLSDEQRKRILTKLKTRINNKGILKVVSQKHRNQSANKKAVIERFVSLLQQALIKTPPRLETKIPKAANLRRLENKKHRSNLKQQRTKKTDWDD